MTAPSPEDFRALARSSPWRWTTLRFTVRWPGDPWKSDSLRAWLRRPDLLRVEAVGGELVDVVRERRQQISVLTTDGGRTQALPWVVEGPTPEFRADGLVATPRPHPGDLSYDAPMYRDYFWVAMLDPVELADGRDPDDGGPAGPGVDVDDVTVVEQAGRVAWEAVVRTTPVYEPRCGCCPLLRSRRVDELENADHPDAILAEYPEAYRVRLDVQTGVCVRTEAIGGLAPGSGHDLRIQAVDEPMDDALFVPPRRGLFRRQ